MYEDTCMHPNVGYDAAPPMPIVFEKLAPCSDVNDIKEYKFKYVPEEKFTRILKHVKRSKKKEQEDKEWLKFVANTNKWHKYGICREECESLMQSNVSKSESKGSQKQHSEHLKLSESDNIQDCHQNHNNTISEVSVSDQYKDDTLSDKGKGNKNKEETISVSHKFHKKHVQMSNTLSDDKLVRQTSSSTLLETIDEEPSSSPGSEYLMLNDSECVFQQRPFNKNKSIKPDMSKSSHDCCEFKEKVASIVPKLNLHEISKEGIQSQRIRTIHKKMSLTLDSILTLFHKIPEPDGRQDLLRRCKRATEFSSRFSRNYLYHLRRQVYDLKKQIRESMSLSKAQHTFHQAMCQKLVASHQSALQGLQAYLHHMPSSVQGASSDKLKELLQYINELTRLCKRLGVASFDSSSEYGRDYIEKKSKALLLLISKKDTVKGLEDNLLISQDTTVNVMTTTGQRQWESSLREPRKAKAPAISVRGQDKSISWKESATKLARAAYGAPSKKHFATLKSSRKTSSCKVIKQSPTRMIEPIPKKTETCEKVSERASLLMLSPTPKTLAKLHIIEESKIGDNIKTAIESFPSDNDFQEQACLQKCGSALKMPTESSSNIDVRQLSSRFLNICEEEIRNKLGSIVRSLVENSEFQVSLKSTEMSAEQSSTSVEDMKIVLQHIQNLAAQSLQQSKSDNTLHTIQENNQKKSTRVGAKNAQLICLPADVAVQPQTISNSLGKREKSQESIKRSGSCDLNDHKKYNKQKSQYPEPNDIYDQYVSMKSSESNGNKFSEGGLQKVSSDLSHMKRDVQHQYENKLQSSMPTTLILPEKHIEAAMAYHQKFHDYMKTNPMYKSTVQPWAIANRLSVRLIEEVLQEMVSETKLEMLVQNIYTLELGIGNSVY